jgi:hypothetical protein
MQAEKAGGAPVTYDLDYSDEFWRGNAHSAYPNVAGPSVSGRRSIARG